MKRRRVIGLCQAVLLSLACPVNEAAEPVVEMPAFHVSETLANVVVSPRFEGQGLRRETDGRILCLVVQDVKAGTVAARAGLVKGMEIHALQGEFLRGLTEEQVLEVMRKPLWSDLVLKVRRPGGFRLFDLTIPVKRPASVPPGGQPRP